MADMPVWAQLVGGLGTLFVVGLGGFALGIRKDRREARKNEREEEAHSLDIAQKSRTLSKGLIEGLERQLAQANQRAANIEAEFSARANLVLGKPQVTYLENPLAHVAVICQAMMLLLRRRHAEAAALPVRVDRQIAELRWEIHATHLAAVALFPGAYFAVCEARNGISDPWVFVDEWIEQLPEMKRLGVGSAALIEAANTAEFGGRAKFD